MGLLADNHTTSVTILITATVSVSATEMLNTGVSNCIKRTTSLKKRINNEKASANKSRLFRIVKVCTWFATMKYLLIAAPLFLSLTDCNQAAQQADIEDLYSDERKCQLPG